MNEQIVKMKDVIIRNETDKDYRVTEELVRESFWNVYRPGCVEHFLLRELRKDPDYIPELAFVMEKDGRMIGQNIFVRAKISLDDGGELPVLTMGPIGIAPDFKRKGYGKLLLDYSLEKAKEWGCKAVCLEGNIDFYGKSGFVPAYTRGIRYHGMPEGEVDDFFLSKELLAGYFDGVSGEYAAPGGYFAAEEKAAEFDAYDAAFPKKEKLVLPTQLF